MKSHLFNDFKGIEIKEFWFIFERYFDFIEQIIFKNSSQNKKLKFFFE